MQFHPSYHLAGASPLPLDMGYLLLVGSNILLLMVVKAASCNFGVLAGEDEHTSFYSTILPVNHLPVIKTIPMEKKRKTAKWLSEEALQIAVKRREAKGKGGKERYTHLNAEF